jgi:CO dehydrogenase nickel-insertion accessory protein CooC1
MSSVTINIAAKSGQGKTTITALLAKFLNEQGFTVEIEPDADYAGQGNLSNFASVERFSTVADKSSITITQTQLPRE